MGGSAAPESGRQSLRLNYFLRVRNVGDRVNPAIVRAATGCLTTWAADRREPHLLAIGSMMGAATPSSLVWGTGVLHPSSGIGSADPARVLAVRGKLTHAEFCRAGQPLRDVPLGDPGYLITHLLGWRRDPEPKYELGIVPHYVDRDHAFVGQLSRLDGVTLLDVTAPETEFFAKLSACRAVLSSSLHGLIFAEALGIPSLWIELSNRVLGEGFKFRDWYSLGQKPQMEPFRPRGLRSIAELRDRCELHNVAIDTSALISALSCHLLDDACRVDPRPHPLPVDACRLRPPPVFVVVGEPTEPRSASDPMLQDGDVVLVRTRAAGATLVAELNAAVDRFFADWAEPSPYAVVDGMAELSRIDARALGICVDLLDRYPRAEMIAPVTMGPAPAALEWMQCRLARVGCEMARLDGVFGVHRASEPVGVGKAGVRAYVPLMQSAFAHSPES